MNSRTGIVMKAENNTIYLMTSDGEFVKVKLNKKDSLPMIGSEYCGQIIKPSFIRNNIFKYASVACLMLFTLLGGGGAYAYYKPVSTVTISINPSIELKSNTWGKVISATPINEDGKKILQEISLKNKTVDNALLLILDQSKKDKFIKDNYVNNNTIQVSIKGKELSLSSFERKLSEDTLAVKIDNNGTIIYNKNLKSKDNPSLENKKDTKNTSEKDSNVNKDNSTVKDDDKQKSDKSNSSNKNSKADDTNSNDANYNSNIKSNNDTIHKEKNSSDINSKNKEEDDSKIINNRNSNNNGHYSENKDKKDKK